MRRGKSWHLIGDGTESPPYESIGEARFSPDSRRLIYSASRGGAWRLVTDARESGAYQALGACAAATDAQ